jgi:hypothetical protein
MWYYQAVDVFGVDMRRRLIVRFSQRQLRPYDNSFAFGKEVRRSISTVCCHAALRSRALPILLLARGQFSGLAFVDRRYKWFRRLCDSLDGSGGSAPSLAACFPPHWNILQVPLPPFSRSHPI